MAGEADFSPVSAVGRARMVDVTGKPVSVRTAVAEGRIAVSEATAGLIRRNEVKKGDVLAVARIAGIGAAKETARLIPLCHPVDIGHVDVELTVGDGAVRAVASVRSVGRTGAEMEALAAVSLALLTVYDMCKAVDKGMRLEGIRLVRKTKEEPR